MDKEIQAVFNSLETLIKLDIPFEKDSEEYKLVAEIGHSPRVVKTYQEFLTCLDLEPLHDVPWCGWVSSVCRLLVEGISLLEEMVSLSQITILKATVCKLINCVVRPNLPCDLPYPNNFKGTFKLTQQQKFVCLDMVTRLMLIVMKLDEHVLMEIMRHYGVLLCSLLHLHASSAASKDAEAKKLFYHESVTKLLDDFHQPTVFTHLMILHNVKGEGGKMSRIVRKILMRKLEAKGGVESLLGATILADEAPASTQDIMKISNLLISKQTHQFYSALLPQVIALLQNKDSKCHQVAACCIARMHEQDSLGCNTHLLDPLLSALEKPSSSQDIEMTVRNIGHWVSAAPPEVDLSRTLPLLCNLYASICHTPASLKSLVTSTLTLCLNKLVHPCPFMISLIFPPQPEIRFVLDSSCSVFSVSSSEALDYQEISHLILDLINKLNLVKAKVDLYRSLLCFIVNPTSPIHLKMICTEFLTELSSDKVILDHLCEEPKCLIDFLIELFSNDVEEESISLGLILLTIFLNDKLIHKKSNWSVIAKLVKPLRVLACSPVYSIKTLADEILSRLTQVGIIASNNEEVVPLQKAETSQAEDQSFDKAYSEITDAQLPVRAHGLRSMAKLLMAKDKKTLQHKHILFNIFKANLDDADSFLYLSAVEGLANLATVLPDDIIILLCREFKSKDGKPELRVKIGQVIVKTVNQIGDMGAVYKKELLDSLLIGARDPDALVRASSLSAIGEVAKILSFHINSYIVEILDCVDAVVGTDKEPEPRRAGVLLVSLLLQGLDKSSIMMLEDVLPSIYRKLKKLMQTDIDDVIRLHAEIALQHLSHTIKEILFSKPALTKRISVLDINQS